MKNSWREILDRAYARRSELLADDKFDAWRLFHGYEEGCSGVTIEKFGRFAVIDFKSDIRVELNEVARILAEQFELDLIVAKGHQSLQLKLKNRMFPLLGEFSSSPVFAEEYGVHYSIQTDAVHNCGLYLDARPVRKWLHANSADRRVLNLFAFTGSLGLAAAQGGARDVVHLDKSAELLPRIKQSYKKNAFVFDDRNFLRGDIYKHLPRAVKHGQRFDGIILDPPPKVYYSRYADRKPKGQDFAQLIKLCSKILSDQGWLVALFHRFDSSWDEHEEEIITASNGMLIATERFTSDDDFPESNAEHKLRVSVFRKL